MLTVLKSGVKLIIILVFHAQIIIKNTFDFDEFEVFSFSLYSY